MYYYLKSWIHPILLTVGAVCTVISTYFKSTHDGDAIKNFPFISDTGNRGVSASLFTFLFSICEFLVFTNMAVRFEQIKTRYNYREHKCKFIANVVFIFIGLIACLGLKIVYSFQIDTHSTVHDVGAVLAFGTAVLYFLLQSVFSFFLLDLQGSHVITNIIRIILSLLHIGALAATVTMVLVYLASSDSEDRRISAILQWTMFFLVMMYPLTFIREFYHFDMHVVPQRKDKHNKIGDNPGRDKSF